MKTLIERMDALLDAFPVTESVGFEVPTDLVELRCVLAETLLESVMPPIDDAQYNKHVAAAKDALSPKSAALAHRAASLRASELGHEAHAKYHHTAGRAYYHLHLQQTGAKARPAPTSVEAPAKASSLPGKKAKGGNVVPGARFYAPSA